LNRSDFGSLAELATYVANREQHYADTLFNAIYMNAGNLQAWYNEPNKVPTAWRGKMAPSPKEQTESWDQVGEIVIGGLVYRHFTDWVPIGLPIGSDARFSSEDSVIHLDVKTHKEGDGDLDRTQDIRPEQVSADETGSYLLDKVGRLGNTPPKLPPFYDFGPDLLKVTISCIAVCVYKVDLRAGFQYLTRIQLFTVPNGILRDAGQKDAWPHKYEDCFRPGKDGRLAHRYRAVLPKLKAHETWRWREISYKDWGFEVTR